MSGAGPEPLLLADDAATAAFGAALADRLRPRDIVLLEGDLGAGKTALARAILRRLLDDAALDVPSPSFAIVQPYSGRGREIIHADLYRLADAAELDELGLLDAGEAILLVEWAARAPALVARADLVVTLAIPLGGEGRLVSLRFRDPARR